MNSPRSLEACRQLGIIPRELYFQDFETYSRLNPEVKALPKEIQKIRFENIDNYRKETIQMVIEQREKIININKNREKNLDKNNQTSFDLNLKTNNINNNINISNDTPKKISNNMSTISFYENNNANINEDKQFPIYNANDRLYTLIEKEKKNIEKIKRRQKNEIEAEIENKIKTEIIKLKSELKEIRIQKINEQLQEKSEALAKKEEEKRINKEKRRIQDLKKNLIKKEEENKKKHEIEEKRLKEMKEFQIKSLNEYEKKKFEEKIKLKKRKEAILNHQRELEFQNSQRLKLLEQKEKERLLLKESKRKGRLIEQQKQKEENIKRLIHNKQTFEDIMKKVRQNIELKHLLSNRRFNELKEERENKLKKQRSLSKKKTEEIKNKLEQRRILIEKRNEEILQKQKIFEEKAIKNGRIKLQKIIEKSKSQKSLYYENKKRRIQDIKHLEEKYQKINKEFEEKQEKYNQDKIKKLFELSLKQEEDFIKQFKKKQNLIRLERINQYKNEIKTNEFLEKEQKIEIFKKKKKELMESKAKLTAGVEKEKKELIIKFENSLKNKKQIDAEIIKDLFPDDLELYKRIKKLTDKINEKNELIKAQSFHNTFMSCNDDKDKEKDKKN